jgi:hypothetical protein
LPSGTKTQEVFPFQLPLPSSKAIANFDSIMVAQKDHLTQIFVLLLPLFSQKRSFQMRFTG